MQGKVSHRGKNVDQFLFTFAFKNIGPHINGIEIEKTQFLTRFAQEGLFDLLTVIYVTAHGSVPITGQQVLGQGTFLQVKFARTVQDMQMHHGMQGLLGSMAPGASRLADDDSVLVHQRQHFAGKRRGGRPERRMREYGGRFIGIQQFKHG